jgi:hypothetical protein
MREAVVFVAALRVVVGDEKGTLCLDHPIVVGHKSTNLILSSETIALIPQRRPVERVTIMGV